jgi:hypothetical protein
VPVVCVTGAFTLTPLFAHNQSAVLNQLLSPAEAMPYNANINVDNVEVCCNAIICHSFKPLRTSGSAVSGCEQ